MRPRSVVLLFFLFVSSTPFLRAQTLTTSQTTTASSNQALASLQNAISALAGRATVNDVTLSGTAERIAGSDDETGTATYKALLGASRLDMILVTGTRSETRNATGPTPAGCWIGTDMVSHSMAYHNLLLDPGWFPLFTLANINSSNSSVLTYLGPEIRNGVSVIHFVAFQQSPLSSAVDTALFQHLTQVDVYLASTTQLPYSLVFNNHPDNNMLLDISTEIRYSNYQTIGGAQIPMHVQKFINNSLALDLQFQSAVLNSGLSTNLFTVQ